MQMKSNNLFTIFNPKSLQSEGYRMLRTNLQFASAGKDLRSIVVTSSTPGEGKSTTSINLAVTLAQADNEVLLVDCDLRKSSLHKYLRLSNSKGLSGFLAGMDSLEDVIQKTQVDRLNIITAGPLPPNPAELLGSITMERFLKTIRNQYDFVILDCPPVVALTDGAVLSASSDGTVLVVASGETPIEVAQTAKENLQKVGANLLGVVLNKTKIDQENYYYYDYNSSKENEEKNPTAEGKRKPRKKKRSMA